VASYPSLPGTYGDVGELLLQVLPDNSEATSGVRLRLMLDLAADGDPVAADALLAGWLRDALPD